MIWHYAVWKGADAWYMLPACRSREDLLKQRLLGENGITIIRGNVNCPNCMRMMGMP